MPNLTRCKDCGREVSKRAKTCPHCGVSKPGKAPPRRAGIGSYLLAGVLIVVFFQIALQQNEYGDGEQVRDFIYVQDAVAMTLFFHDHPEINGLFNVGSGQARCWNDLAAALFSAMNREPEIEYIEMPESIRDQYQYHTCAEMDKIHEAGYNHPVLSLEDAVSDYVNQYLIPGKHLIS